MLGFNVDHTIIRHKPGQEGRKPLDPALAIRRIEKQHIETRTVSSKGGGAFYRIPPYHPQAPGSIEQPGIRLKRSEHRCRLFNHHHASRPARRGFEAEGAAAGKEIKTGKARQILTQPVEQGFTHPVGRRPQSERIRKAEDAATPFAANDTHRIQSRVTRRRRLRSPGFPTGHVEQKRP